MLLLAVTATVQNHQKRDFELFQFIDERARRERAVAERIDIEVVGISPVDKITGDGKLAPGDSFREPVACDVKDKQRIGGLVRADARGDRMNGLLDVGDRHETLIVGGKLNPKERASGGKSVCDMTIRCARRLRLRQTSQGIRTGVLPAYGS